MAIPMGNFADNRYGGGVFHVFASGDGDIQFVAQPEDGRGHEQTEQQADGQDNHAARLDGRLGAEGLFDKPHVGFADGHLQGHLFAFVEQIGVEGRFEFLLSLYVEPLFLFFGHGAHFAVERSLGVFGTLQLKFNRVHIA